VRPGEKAEFAITVQNTGPEDQSQSLELTGLPDAWYHIDYNSSERARPGETRRGSLIVAIPMNVKGGTYDFDVSVLSGAAESSAAGSIQVASILQAPSPFDDAQAAPEAHSGSNAPPASLDVVPPVVALDTGLVIWRGAGQPPERKLLTIRNPGGAETEYVIEVDGLEPSWYTVLNRLRVDAGRDLQTEFMIHPPADARRQDYPYRILVRADGRPDLRAEVIGWLSLQSAPAEAARPTQTAPSGLPAEPVQPRVTPSGERVTPPDVTLAPRSSFQFNQSEPVAQALVTVTNRGKLRERYAIVINGIPDDWYRLSDQDVRLNPGESRQISLRLNPVTGPGFPAGAYEFLVHAVPDGLPEYYCEALGVLSISGIARYEARLEPLQAQGLRKDFNVRVENVGDTPLRIAIRASDPESRCKIKAPAPRDILVGQVGLLQMKVGARRQGMVGPPETFDFRIKLTDEENGGQSARDTFDGRFIHQPKMSYRSVFLTGFMAALAGLIFLLVWLLTPAFEGAADWVGCQLDADYRLSADANPIKKESCGGAPRQEELDRWQRQQQAVGHRSIWKPGPQSTDVLPSALAWPA
jgi:hypothetical protein